MIEVLLEDENRPVGVLRMASRNRSEIRIPVIAPSNCGLPLITQTSIRMLHLKIATMRFMISRHELQRMNLAEIRRAIGDCDQPSDADVTIHLDPSTDNRVVTWPITKVDINTLEVLFDLDAFHPLDLGDVSPLERAITMLR